MIAAIWSRIAGAAVEIVARVAGQQVAAARLVLDGEIGRAELTGLLPDTVHEIAIDVAGLVLGPHRVRTAPRADEGRPVRVAVLADCDPSPEFASGLIDALAAAAPEIAISIGDFPYTDNGPPARTFHSTARATPGSASPPRAHPARVGGSVRDLRRPRVP